MTLELTQVARVSGACRARGRQAGGPGLRYISVTLELKQVARVSGAYRAGGQGEARGPHGKRQAGGEARGPQGKTARGRQVGGRP